ncbi:MAG: dienelactone hydrolase family protein [Pseudomonadota bacterium]
MSVTSHRFIGASVSLPYLLGTPNIGIKKPLPLVVFLHGAKDRGDDLSKLLAWGFPKLVKEAPYLNYYWLAPQIPVDTKWPDWQNELFTLIDELVANNTIDTDRIILSGFSLGSAGAWQIGSEHADRFSGLVIVSGRVPESVGEEELARLKNTAVWVFHGGRDDKVPAASAEAAVNTLKKIGAPVQYTLIPEGDHFIAEAAYGNSALQQWLVAQHRPEAKDEIQKDNSFRPKILSDLLANSSSQVL